jgi:hypothetical protein
MVIIALKDISFSIPSESNTWQVRLLASRNAMVRQEHYLSPDAQIRQLRRSNKCDG